MSSAAYARAIDTLDQYLGPIRPYREDPTVQEIMINRPDSIYIERAGVMSKLDGVAIDPAALQSAIVILGNINNKGQPALFDARLHGLRLAAARQPTSIHGDFLSIRTHARTRLGITDYLKAGAFNVIRDQRRTPRTSNAALLHRLADGGDAVAEFLAWIVKHRINVAVSGGTSSGKTTFLDALLREIPKDERLLTIEDTAELSPSHPNYVGLEASDDVSVRSLVKFALRCRPDRIVVGEVRGPEAMDVVSVLNTGHRGSFFTFHANSSEEAPYQLELLLLMSEEGRLMPLDQLRAKIAATFRFFIHAERFDGVRGPVEIREVQGVDNGRYITKLLFNRFVDIEDHNETEPTSD
jgi:pilus assembly protein CpaF